MRELECVQSVFGKVFIRVDPEFDRLVNHLSTAEREFTIWRDRTAYTYTGDDSIMFNVSAQVDET